MGIGSKEWMDWVMEEEEGLELLKAAWDRGECEMRNGLGERILGLTSDIRSVDMGYGQCLL